MTSFVLQNQNHRFVLAAANLVIGILLLYRTISLDKDGVSRCVIEHRPATGTGKHKSGSTVRVDPSQGPCQPFTPKLISAVCSQIAKLN